MRDATQTAGRGSSARGPPLPTGTDIGSEVTATGDLVLGEKKEGGSFSWLHWPER